MQSKLRKTVRKVYTKPPQGVFYCYYIRVEEGREEGNAKSVGQLQLSPTAESGDPPRELPRGNYDQPKNYPLQFFFNSLIL